jgi:hypothetical protein
MKMAESGSSSEFEIQLRSADQWTAIGRTDEQDEAERTMLSRLSEHVTQGRVIEVRTTVTRTVVNRAAYMGDTDDDIVQAVVEGRHL